jgi:hypothetical protein
MSDQLIWPILGLVFRVKRVGAERFFLRACQVALCLAASLLGFQLGDVSSQQDALDVTARKILLQNPSGQTVAVLSAATLFFSHAGNSPLPLERAYRLDERCALSFGQDTNHGASSLTMLRSHKTLRGVEQRLSGPHIPHIYMHSYGEALSSFWMLYGGGLRAFLGYQGSSIYSTKALR